MRKCHPKHGFPLLLLILIVLTHRPPTSITFSAEQYFHIKTFQTTPFSALQSSFSRLHEDLQINTVRNEIREWCETYLKGKRVTVSL
jgi:hypothetical protein